jgi:hypothetical protein
MKKSAMASADPEADPKIKKKDTVAFADKKKK